MSSDDGKQIDSLIEILIYNEEIYQQLNQWGKSILLILDGEELYFDFSQKPENVLQKSKKGDNESDFLIKTQLPTLMDLLRKKIDPVETLAQGLVEVEGSYLELIQFAEILSEKINSLDG